MSDISFRKVGAWTLLTTILLPMLAWSAVRIFANSERISRLETSEEYKIDMIKEIRKDVEYIRERIDK